ncbi:putative RND superfamily exporter protein [Nonomuraea muscovyensis]|jgi:hypothetical protein|uniref:Putative RND superfamily exporter protein n=1 Tax=Nonomuraea muscovyensis TaxID=1124761 RepID=A0A7X0C4S0_9ACTN|nr:hypothetical protein [Nonomuraea muscovyensis]MBB6348143.1 putative RND superfamily exporter protein [Nonomuraea muscovyensis]
MVTNRFRAAVPEAPHRTMLSGRVLRAVVSAHTVAVVGQPVFAGVYLSGDYDGLRWHAVGADVVSAIGLVQVIVAIVVWVRLRRVWPFFATLAVVVAETVQYLAGLDGALWLHLPLGVMTVAGLVVLFIAVWLRPLRRRPPIPQTVEEPKQQEAGHA